MRTLNLFYGEPDPDRWLPLDRYPRRVVRRVVRGAPRPGGQQLVYLNLRKGLDRLGVPYRANDFGHARRHPEELACIIGKPSVLFERAWRNPVLFGASVFSHPIDCPDLFDRYPVRRVLVPGEWMRTMCEPWYGDRVSAWPVGIDTDAWTPASSPKDVDVLLYNKIRWDHACQEATLLRPIRGSLRDHGLTSVELRYGHYREEEFHALLGRARMMVFVCEHETQGIAYQQALSCGVPLLAWDRGGEWTDPSYFPYRVRFGPVTSVPYWDDRCGLRFTGAQEFPSRLDVFLEALHRGDFRPRDYILENLTLERCAERYVEIARDTA